MNLFYPKDNGLIYNILNTIDLNHNEIICIINDSLIIYNNGLVKIKMIPPYEVFNVLRHYKLTSISSINLTKNIVTYLEQLPKSIDTIVIKDIKHLFSIQHVLYRNYQVSLYPFKKLHYDGKFNYSTINILRINNCVTELVLPLLDNIEDIINLNSNIKTIGVHGEAYYSFLFEQYVWYKLLDLIKRRSDIIFVLFFRSKTLKDVLLQDLPNVRIKLY